MLVRDDFVIAQWRIFVDKWIAELPDITGVFQGHGKGLFTGMPHDDNCQPRKNRASGSG